MRYYLEVFDRLEKEHKVGQWECGGVHVWPLVKFLLAREIFDYVKQKGLVPLAGAKKRLLFAASLGADFMSRAPATPADICLLTYSSCRQYRVGDKWFNIFQDPLLYLGNGSTVTTLEVLNTYPTRKPPLNRTHSITLPVLGARILSHRLTPRRLKNEIAEVLRQIEQHSDVIGPTHVDSLKQSASEAIPYVFRLADVFQRHLENLRPRLGLLSAYYNLTGIAFCLACRRMGIPSADISHGSSGKSHYAYAGWYGAPNSGYELLPRDFLTRSEWDAEAPEALFRGSSFHRPPTVVGDLASHVWRENGYRMAQPARTTLDRIRGRDERTEVLIALQDANGLTPLLLEVMRKLSGQCFFWIRLHPMYVTNPRDFQVDADASCFNVVEATSQPLFALLERVDAVISESSSVAEDALPWGVLPIITHEVGRFLFIEHIEQGRMIYAPNSSEIITALTEAGERLELDYRAALASQRKNLNAYLAAS